MNNTPRMITTTQVPPRLIPWTLPQASWTGNQLTHQMNLLSLGFDPISLKEMDDVALLDRIDTKFVLTARQLLLALPHLRSDYWVLQVNSQRLNHYRTLYFDTPKFSLYHAHVNDRSERYKVRMREYLDSHLSFLEVKHHTRKDRTIKNRILTPQPVVQIDPTMENWLSGVFPMPGNSLEPMLWNTFTRLTLVSKQCCERLTLDIDLVFSTDDRRLQLDDIVVAEVKMSAEHQKSPFIAQMRQQRIHPQGFSKYAFGTAKLFPQVKTNALKPKMLWVEKTMKGSAYSEQSW
jgi:hypothetical protein